jgi:hypothetical protein
MPDGRGLWGPHCWSIGHGRFLTPTRAVDDVPSPTCHHIATDGPFAFGPWFVIKLSAIAWTAAWWINLEITFRSVMVSVGGLMSMELTGTDGITMVGFDDGVLM